MIPIRILSRLRRAGPVQLTTATAVLLVASASSCLVPSPSPGATQNVLTSASAGGSGGLLAVGWTASRGLRSPMAMHRASNGWQLEHVPAPGKADAVFNAVTVLGDARHGDTAWAVGKSDPKGSAPAQTFVAFRAANGKWQTVQSPNPPGANVLNAVFAGYASMCEEICEITVVAAGTTVTNGVKKPLVISMGYPVGGPPDNSPTWTIVDPEKMVGASNACGSPAGRDIELFSVNGGQDPEHPLGVTGRRGRCPLSLTAQRGVWSDNLPPGVGVIYAQGSGWSVGADNLLLRAGVRGRVPGLSGRYVEWRAITPRPRTDGSVWVAGRASRTSNRSGPFDPVLARWNGHSWQLSPVQPLPKGGAFYGIALTTRNALWSVGTSGPDRYTLTDSR